MITTMMWVIIVIIILVLLMILVLKMTKKYHITWYWCQNIRDNMVKKKGQQIRAGVSPPPHFWAIPERKHFIFRIASLIDRVRRVGFFNFGSGRVRVLKKYFGSGRVGYRVFVSNTKSIGYYGVLKSWSGIRRVSPLFPILSNIYYLIWLIWSIKHVFGRHIYVMVVQCGRSWQPFGDRRKSHKPLESAHLQNFATKI